MRHGRFQVAPELVHRHRLEHAADHPKPHVGIDRRAPARQLPGLVLLDRHGRLRQRPGPVTGPHVRRHAGGGLSVHEHEPALLVAAFDLFAAHFQAAQLFGHRALHLAQVHPAAMLAHDFPDQRGAE